jgi:hypothetical protein
MIKKIQVFWAITMLFVCFGLWPSVVLADGPANVYKITITKMELFNGTSWVTVFSGTSATIDIASVSSGEFAGNFLTGIQVPDGTYTRVRTTVSRTFTIKGNDGVTPRYTIATANANGCQSSVVAADEAECTITIPTAEPEDTTTFSTPISALNGIFSHKIRVSFNTSTAIGTANGANGIFPAAPIVLVEGVAL